MHVQTAFSFPGPTSAFVKLETGRHSRAISFFYERDENFYLLFLSVWEIVENLDKEELCFIRVSKIDWQALRNLGAEFVE